MNNESESTGAAAEVAAARGVRPRERMVLWLVLAGTLVAVVIAGLLDRGSAARSELPKLGAVPATPLLDRTGHAVDLPAALAGKVWVVDFVFTRCALTCPRMTAEMLRLEERLMAEQSRVPGLSEVQLVSITVDPDYDRPEVLAAYAKAYQIERPHWWLLTGDPPAVRDLVRNGFKLALEATPPGMASRDAEPITHSSRFVLVDANGQIRSYVDAFAEGARDRLLADLVGLVQEAAAETPAG